MAGMALLLVTSAASAQSRPHVHGTGELNIAVEGETVIIELTAPGSDIVGFEHEPQTDEDREVVAAAVAKLNQGERLFNFPTDARCRLEEVEVESGLMEGGGHAEAKPPEAHAEFRAGYRFRCSLPEALNYVDLTYFSSFPRAAELDARTITPQGQGAAELTAASPRLRF
jgi:hypothetical protein